MSGIPPFRLNARPQLRIALSHFNGSPRAASYSTPTSSGASTSYTTPHSWTTYSPLRSANLKIPKPYSGNRKSISKRERLSAYGTCVLWVIKRILRFKIVWFIVLCILFVSWWLPGDHYDFQALREGAAVLRKDLFPEAQTRNMQFFPASNPKIHASVSNWLKVCRADVAIVCR